MSNFSKQNIFKSLLYLLAPMVVILAFFIGQIYLLARAALRLARFSAEIRIYNQWRAR